MITLLLNQALANRLTSQNIIIFISSDSHNQSAFISFIFYIACIVIIVNPETLEFKLWKTTFFTRKPFLLWDNKLISIQTGLHKVTIQVAQFTIYTKDSITFCRFSLNLFIWLDQEEPARYQLADRFTGRIKRHFQFIPTAVPKSKRSL